jgi:hypothetical protein
MASLRALHELPKGVPNAIGHHTIKPLKSTSFRDAENPVGSLRRIIVG